MGKSIYTAEQVKLQELLRRVRQQAGLTQEQLAAKLRRPQSYVSKYESGERRLDIIELREICSKVGCKLTEFAAMFERGM